MKSLWLSLLLLALAVPALSTPAQAQPRDLTQRVKDLTQADEELARLCQQYCLGEEAAAEITRVTELPGARGLVVVEAEVALRSRSRNPVLPFDHTVYISGEGLLDPATCLMTVKEARVRNDFQNLFEGLLREQNHLAGLQYPIPDCRTVLGR